MTPRSWKINGSPHRARPGPELLDTLEGNTNTVSVLMEQFDGLMFRGRFNVLLNGGLGDIEGSVAPYYQVDLG